MFSVVFCGFVGVLNAVQATFGGGGPENVLLVVNPRSQASLTIANHYANLRLIPAENIIFLPWDSKAENTDIDTFRREILLPILKQIQQFEQSAQIDYVVYSSDFPWGIKLDADIREFAKQLGLDLPQHQNGKKPESENKPSSEPKKVWPPQLTPVGSLTGLTYLWQAVAARQPAYFDLRSNYYMRHSADKDEVGASMAFRSNRRYDNYGRQALFGGRQYLLSMMLAVTAGRGNTVPEVIEYLKRSASADGTFPKGTIYFMQNNDIRSKVRQGLFPAAVRELKKLGINAEILEGDIPRNRNDVQGTVVSVADFDWKSSGSTILPGAICEHFTSTGGVMYKGAGQTPLSEFLRYGAAASSGTVTEPYAIAEKFPTAFIQVHYARGCSAAEAFYQSVFGPYQLLIVGDPLCQPWARPPQVTVEGLPEAGDLQGRLVLKPRTQPAADRFELYVDGRRWGHCYSGGTLSLDSSQLPDGYHELRIVAIGLPPIETQGRMVTPVKVNNHNRQIEIALNAAEPLSTTRSLALTVRAPGAHHVVVFHGSREVGQLEGAEGRIEIPPGLLGAGPVRLQAIAYNQEGRAEAAAAPILCTLQ